MVEGRFIDLLYSLALRLRVKRPKREWAMSLLVLIPSEVVRCEMFRNTGRSDLDEDDV